MKNLLAIITVSLIFACLTGCEQQTQTSSDYKLSGRPDLQLSAIARYIHPDSGVYLTRQRYDIYTSPEGLKLTSFEPAGDIILTLQNGESDVSADKPKRRMDKNLYDMITDSQIAKCVLELQLAATQGADLSASAQSEPLSFDGRLYDLAYQSDGVNLYKSRTSGRADLAVLKNSTGNLACYGYNFQTVVQQKGLYASKIDIYDNGTGLDKKLIAQIEFSIE